MNIVTRFAPSPTGLLHVGNLRTALHNWLWARKHGGKFLLRIDDTDLARSREEYVDAIQADLAWLGMVPDAMVRQSARFERYEACFEALKASGRVYPAYETAQELELKRKIRLGRGLPPVYDRAALALSDAERARLEGEAIAPHWRFKLDHDAPIEWDDLVRGAQKFDPAHLSDPVVRRADGSWLYLLPSVIDDIDLAVTHVVRGEDHVSNTASQLQMFAALGGAAPAFAHEALLTGSEGKLSKRLGAVSVADFRADGIEPEALRALLARLGTSDSVEALVDWAPLIAGFDFARFGRAPARFDDAELAGLNTRIVHQLDFAQVADRLPEGMDEPAWLAVRPNLAIVADAAHWWDAIQGRFARLEFEPEDRAYLAAAAEAAGAMTWGDAPWQGLTGALKETTGRKGRALFQPLRRALTGEDHGPDMAALLPLIGQAAVVERLRRASAP